MNKNEKYHAPFEPGNYYHIYNRTNNREKLFRSNENYFFFLRQYEKYISPFAETFAYNLLPNHFHLICRVRGIDDINQYLLTIPEKSRLKAEIAFLENPEKYIGTLVEAEFNRFFTSYAMAFNKMFSRKGNLFQRRFKRLAIENDAQFCQAMVYVHANAVRHKIAIALDGCPFSSYQAYCSADATFISKEHALGFFGGKEAFIKFHETQTKYYYENRFEE